MKKGWTYKKLGEVFPIVMGKTPPRNIAKFWDVKKETRNLWVSIADLSKYEGKEIHETKEYISDEGKQNIKLIPKGSLLVSFKLTLGKMAFAGEDLYTNEAIISLPKREDIDLMFLYYYFSYIDWNKIASGNEKVKGKTLNKSSLSVIPIPVLPLSEQRAIVSRLDSAFSKIDSLKANAEKQVSEARALFQKALSKAMEPKEGWEEKQFGEVCFYHKEQGIYKNSTYIGMEHIESGTGRVIGSMSSNDVLSTSFKFNKGEVLYGRLRPYLKKVYIAEFDGCCSTEVFPIYSEVIDAGFIKYWFLTDEITNKIVETSAGCRMPRGNMNQVKGFTFSFPPLSVQHRIVEHLDSLSAHVKQLEENQQKIIAESDSLKQSILRNVFEE